MRTPKSDRATDVAAELAREEVEYLQRLVEEMGRPVGVMALACRFRSAVRAERRRGIKPSGNSGELP